MDHTKFSLISNAFNLNGSTYQEGRESSHLFRRIWLKRPNADFENNLRHEALVLAHLDGRSSLRCYDFNEMPPQYISMEFRELKPFRTVFADSGFEKRLSLSQTVSKAMHEMHNLGVINRDLKPDNMFLDNLGGAVFLDFVLAKFGESDFVQPGRTVGALYYMSPELARGPNVGPASDVYAYGVSLYELFSGCRPIEGVTDYEIFSNIINAPLNTEPLDKAVSSPNLRRLIVSCIDKKAASRPSASEITAELGALIEKEMMSPSRPLRVFLCHCAEDKERVRQLYHRLRIDRLQPWLDEEDLLPGQRWEQEIRQAVRSSDVILACLSQQSITKTGYVQKELRFALDIAEEFPDDRIFLIPARLENCFVPDRLKHLQWVDLFEENGYERLLRALSLAGNGRV
ncbi:hypothetical protein F183_A52670 [Bryobacterales bacterium F-183]|nr:hypothetical protein F183_A52670 [Bryobacterales bacterium F-183]